MVSNNPCLYLYRLHIKQTGISVEYCKYDIGCACSWKSLENAAICVENAFATKTALRHCYFRHSSTTSLNGTFFSVTYLNDFIGVLDVNLSNKPPGEV